jgi:ribosomal protein S18 acetylase RimI-like enzyme
VIAMTTLQTPPTGSSPAAFPAGATPTAVPGLVLRPVRWPEEAHLLVEVNNASRLARGSLFVINLEALEVAYAHLINSDLGADLRLAEADGRPVGYVRVEWRDENRGDRVHGAALFTTPDAPGGAFAALLDWILARHREIVAAQGPIDRTRTASISTIQEPEGARAALEARGFAPVRFGFEMLRPSLEEIPDLPMPPGLELRSVEQGQLRRIWEAEAEAFEGHWGAGVADRSEERWQEFLADPFADISLWQVAWAGDEVVGMVRPFINDDENARFDVRRGWCENISTRAPWRGRGLASALICRALRALRERGMTEAALGVDAQNETGALRLYQRMGFRETSRETEWRMPLDPDPPAAGTR